MIYLNKIVFLDYLLSSLWVFSDCRLSQQRETGDSTLMQTFVNKMK